MYCKHCGNVIDDDCIICPKCGKQVGNIKQEQPQVIINNSVENSVVNSHMAEKNKWVALLLCLFLGCFGIHKFYEGKIGTGILYLLTFGLLEIGVIVDFVNILFKPNPYYV